MSEAFSAFAAQVRQHSPQLAVILGSGMGTLAADWPMLAQVRYVEIPGMVATTVLGHAGMLTLNAFAGVPVLLFQGRFHFYEGHPPQQVERPVRLIAELGVPHLLATNAAGGIATTLGRGSLMAIRDHLWWKSPADAVQFQSPRPSVYSPRLIGLLHEVAASLELRLHQGVYCAVTGPSYETSAEIRAMRTWGADAVGMSTAHEIETAAKLGIEPAAISLITNAAAGMTGESLDHHDVFHEAARQATKIGRIIAGLATRLVATT